jgi:peptidoglycan hydrolase CwlO-like protein
MKSLKLVIFLVFTLFLTVALLPACKKAPVSMTPTAVVNDISAEKDQYVKDFQAKVDEYQVKIDELKTKAETASGTVKDDLNKKIDLLTAKQEEAKGKIEELKGATAETWSDVKAGADKVLNEMTRLISSSSRK